MCLQTILGDFQKEQEKFVAENRDKQSKSEAAVPPWVGYNEEESMKQQITALSTVMSTCTRFLRAWKSFYTACLPTIQLTSVWQATMIRQKYDLFGMFLCESILLSEVCIAFRIKETF